jgi:hypothetical protein
VAAPPVGFTPQYDWAYERWLGRQGKASVPMDPDTARYRNRTGRYTEDQLNPDSEAAFLFREVRVVCLVFPTNTGVTEILKLNWWRTSTLSSS